jgi:hypothetical protein
MGGSAGGTEEPRGAGEPLPDPVRSHFEARFGHDFSSVRIRDDAAAHQAASALGARAFTIGTQVTLAGQAPSMESLEGQRLLAHELTHVVQQSQGPPTTSPPLAVSSPTDHAEVEARAVADRVVRGGTAPAISAAAPAIQRDVAPSTADQVREKLSSARDRLLAGPEQRDIRDALQLLSPLPEPDLKALVVALDTQGRLLDELSKAADDDKQTFGSTLAKINRWRNSFLAVQIVTAPGQARFPIAQEPSATLWRFTSSFASATAMVRSASTFVTRSGGKIGTFGILAHGDLPGVIELGSDVTSWETFGTVEDKFAELHKLLAPDADVYIYGCIAGHGAAGTTLLRRISKALPGRRIIAFNVLNVLLPSPETVTPDLSGSNPIIGTSTVTTRPELELNAGKGLARADYFQKLKGAPATADSPHAKMVKDGVVLTWPALSDEQRRNRPKAVKETPDIDGVEPAPSHTPRPMRRGR